MSVLGEGYASLIRWCGATKALHLGRKLHAHIHRHGNYNNSNNNYNDDYDHAFLARMLWQMYTDCGSPLEARTVVAPHQIAPSDTFSWNSLISVHARTRGDEPEALRLFLRMLELGSVAPDRITLLSALSACARLRNLPVGKTVHALIVADCGGWLEPDGPTPTPVPVLFPIPLANALLTMYAKCSELAFAESVFDTLLGCRNRNIISWTAMVGAYARNGRPETALELFWKMRAAGGPTPNRATFLVALNACVALKSLENGREIHRYFLDNGFTIDLLMENALVHMYGKCGSLPDALSVFNSMRTRDLISWTSIVVACAHAGHGDEALELVDLMESQGMTPNAVTFLSILDALGSLRSLEIGRTIHGKIRAGGFNSDPSVATAVLTMYSKCGSLKDAQSAFDEMQARNTIAWNAMISAYAENGRNVEALALYQLMGLEGVAPDGVTFLGAINACSGLGSLQAARLVHARVIVSGWHANAGIRAALVDMYGKCGSAKDACTVFDGTRPRNLIMWTAIIGAYAANGYGGEALELSKRMVSDGFEPNKVTFLGLLDTCASLASLEEGRRIHELIRASSFGTDLSLANALLNMYSKCGSLEHVRTVFDEMPKRDSISWNTVIAAHAQNGHGKEALELFQQMASEEVKPDGVTFTSVLNVCSHTGMWCEGWDLFVSMGDYYGMHPMVEHYVCMIDLLGRAGSLNQARDVMHNMPVKLDNTTWSAFFGACKLHSDKES